MSDPKPGAPSFIELGTPEGGRARRFYEQLFGWSFQEMGGDNFLARTPTVQIGFHTQDADAVFVIYFEVGDIEAAVQRVRAAGGAADDPVKDEKGFGRFVECRDDQGVRFGLRELPRAP